MSEKFPYEDAFEERMRNLPSPDADASWQKMQQMLEEKERRRPFVFFKTRVPLAVIAVILFAVGWYVIHQPNKEKEPPPIADSNTSSKAHIEKNKPGASLPQLKEQITTADKEANTNSSKSNSRITTANLLSPEESKTPVNRKSSLKSRKPAANKKEISNIRNFRNSLAVQENTGIASKNKENKPSVLKPVGGDKPLDRINATGKTNDEPRSATNQTKSEPQKVSEENKDSSSVEKEFELNQSPIEPKKLKGKVNKRYAVSAGVGVQQQIALNGQQNVSLAYNGKSSLADYIPSIYLRLEREKKWYLKTELIYAAPQLVNNFSYFRETASDTASLKTTYYTLKKTYYTDIPLTFNYYIKPNWSLGIGGMYGWFYGAISEKETTSQNLQTQQSVVVKETKLINGFTDSFFYKSRTNLLLQTEYKWRNLSLGLRYSRDMQPYIKYTLPNGVIEDRRNWSLDFILRLQLWKSMK